MIRDRDGKFPEVYDGIPADADIDAVLSGIRMARMNSIIERWVQTCGRELLDRTLIWNRRQYVSIGILARKETGDPQRRGTRAVPPTGPDIHRHRIRGARTRLDRHLTPEMLQQGQRLASSTGLRNIAFVLGDAASLPWLDAQFDLTACRLTLHQVADPRAVVREMVRVTRPTGRIAIIDITADDDPAVAAEANRLEQLRDPSHGRTLTTDEVRQLLAEAGAKVTATSHHDQALDVEDWMERTATPAHVRADIRARFDDELGGGRPTGLRPHRHDDRTLLLTHTWTMVTARLVG